MYVYVYVFEYSFFSLLSFLLPGSQFLTLLLSQTHSRFSQGRCLLSYLRSPLMLALPHAQTGDLS